VIFGGKVKDFLNEAEKNPTRAVATLTMKASVGQMELVAEDDVQKRYTLKDKKSGELTTFYWDEKTSSPETVQGDFSKIPTEKKESAPAQPSSPAATAPVPEEPSSTPAPAAGAAPNQN
jgi:hypothetical protein